MPPEQIQGHKAAAAADQYSIGIMLNEMLAGAPPFNDPEPLTTIMAHMSKEVPSLSECRPDLPEGLVQVVHRMLEKSPNKRFPSLKEVSERLKEFLAPEVQARSGS